MHQHQDNDHYNENNPRSRATALTWNKNVVDQYEMSCAITVCNCVKKSSNVNIIMEILISIKRRMIEIFSWYSTLYVLLSNYQIFIHIINQNECSFSTVSIEKKTILNVNKVESKNNILRDFICYSFYYMVSQTWFRWLSYKHLQDW